MKKILFCLIILSLGNVHASCIDNFNEALSEFHFGNRHFNYGRTAYDEAISESRSDSPSLSLICDKLVASVSGFSVGADSYSKCESLFSDAANTCSGVERENALNNKAVCANNSGIAVDNHNVLKGLLRDSCFVNMKNLEIDILRTLNESQTIL